jgi:hypothetical protein
METASNADTSEARWRNLLTILGVAAGLASLAGELSGYFHFVSEINERTNELLNGAAYFLIGHTLSATELALVRTALAVSLIWSIFFAALCTYLARYEHTNLSNWIGELYFLYPPDTLRVATTKVAGILFISLPILSAYRSIIPPWYKGKFLSCCGLHVKLWLYLWEVGFVTTMLVAGGMILYFLAKAVTGGP